MWDKVTKALSPFGIIVGGFMALDALKLVPLALIGMQVGYAVYWYLGLNVATGIAVLVLSIQRLRGKIGPHD